jgi:hypothetical protein
MQTFELREAMMAVSRASDGHPNLVTLTTGAVLTVAVSTIPLQSGLVDAQWEDQTVSVFVQDLKARGNLVLKAAE